MKTLVLAIAAFGALASPAFAGDHGGHGHGRYHGGGGYGDYDRYEDNDRGYRDNDYYRGDRKRGWRDDDVDVNIYLGNDGLRFGSDYDRGYHRPRVRCWEETFKGRYHGRPALYERTVCRNGRGNTWVQDVDLLRTW